MALITTRKSVDLTVFSLANLMNLIMVLIFLARARGMARNIDIRSTRLLGPYLLLYYLALFGMIGYSFQIGKNFGFVTLVTYIVNQIATFYSYFQVGHG